VHTALSARHLSRSIRHDLARHSRNHRMGPAAKEATQDLRRVPLANESFFLERGRAVRPRVHFLLKLRSWQRLRPKTVVLLRAQDLPAPVQARCGSMVCSTLPLISDRVIALRLDPLPKVLIVVVAWIVVGASILEFISIRIGAPQAAVSSNLAIITAAHADGRALQKNLMPAALSAFRSTAFQRVPGQRQQDGDCTKQKPRTHHNLPLLHGVNDRLER
jgi:hypothetical protein